MKNTRLYHNNILFRTTAAAMVCIFSFTSVAWGCTAQNTNPAQNAGLATIRPAEDRLIRELFEGVDSAGGPARDYTARPEEKEAAGETTAKIRGEAEAAAEQRLLEVDNFDQVRASVNKVMPFVDVGPKVLPGGHIQIDAYTTNPLIK